jgi:hypothetical protein
MVTATVVVHILREWPLGEAGYSRCRTMSQSVQRRSGLPIAEHTPLAGIVREEFERMDVTFRYELEHPHFRRAKPGCAHGKFFKQFDDGLSKPRQDDQIRG